MPQAAARSPGRRSRSQLRGTYERQLDGRFPATGAGGARGGWTGISTGTFHSFIINGLTGATKLQLPFVQNSTVGAIDIIRRPQASDTHAPDELQTLHQS